MSSISETSAAFNLWRQEYQEKNEEIKLQIFPELCSPQQVVNRLASIEGPVDIYCWYEGPQGLPKSGADFMRKLIFKPIHQLKKEAKICLYSLRGWVFKGNVDSMPFSTPLGEAINRINRRAVECLYSSSFFRYCTQVSRESGLYTFINEELPKKKWLFDLSANQKESGTKISALFNRQSSLFDCIEDSDVSSVYSAMQYIEAYYLIHESVNNGLSKGQKKIEIAFVLPNDESKYYVDLPKDIEEMLRLDFGKNLRGVDVNISFQFFRYGESITSRPYVDKSRKAVKVEANQISAYFDYLSQQGCSQKQSSILFLRDVAHNINGWY